MITACTIILGLVAILEFGAALLIWTNLMEVRALLAMMPRKQEPTVDEMHRFFAEPAKPGDVTFHFPSFLKALSGEDR